MLFVTHIIVTTSKRFLLFYNLFEKKRKAKDHSPHQNARHTEKAVIPRSNSWRVQHPQNILTKQQTQRLFAKAFAQERLP